ncbi:DUF4832 domain-containing protein [Massilia sp. CCM 9210]|uniref:DUF4832 domain-containing protein n=1 Tax=Massilia scottii TaxID=3057166 RepID=UPI00279650E9|nr:DUF4832 domain-containing protein [Massilia sp. CCM 9210]MDQ1813259.1 DUF4832 domain-containing protein [Massilia sp. CCM 9210]
MPHPPPLGLPAPARRRLACALFAAIGAAGTAHAGNWETVSASRTYNTIPVESDDTVNPLRGYHRWQNQELVPQAAPARDAFRRYHWRDLEGVQGQFTFGAILADLKTARDQGRKYAFRLRMMAGYDDGQLYAPAYLAGNASCLHGCGFWADAGAASGKTWVPDWNDPFVLARSRALLQALAQAIAASGNAASIAWIDVGLYGQYGEWAIRKSVYTNRPAGIEEATTDTRRALAKMHFEAFPTQQFVMFIPYANRDALRYALLEQTITSKPVGLRADCLAQAGYFRQWTDHADEWRQFADQWRKAPFIAEFCPFESGHATNGPATARAQASEFHISSVGNANFALSKPDDQRWLSLSDPERHDMLMLGREAGYRYGVDSTWVSLTGDGQLTLAATFRNSGNAPTYEPWNVRLEIVDTSGVARWSGSVPVALNALAGGGVSTRVQSSWRVPALAAGTYALRLVARDARPADGQQRRPLAWVLGERDADGGLTLRSLRRR